MTKNKMLNRGQIKLLAIIAMTLNHAANMLMEPSSILREAFIDIGYFTAMTMCFLLLEGYEHTRSKKAYAKRLFLFGLVSQVPFSLAMGTLDLNVMFTLLACFLIFCAMDSEMPGWKRNITVIGLVLFTAICDWPVLLTVAAILFKKSGGCRDKQKAAYCAVCCLFWLQNILMYMPDDCAVLHGFFAMLGVAASGIAVMRFYSGRKPESPAALDKWFFYVYYPAHLMLLWCIGQSI